MCKIASLKNLIAKYEKDLVNAQRAVDFSNQQIDSIRKNKDLVQSGVVIDESDLALAQFEALEASAVANRDDIVNGVIPWINNRIREIKEKIVELEAAAAAEAADEE